MKQRIGIIGFGLIGRYVFDKCEGNKFIDVDFVYDALPEKTQSLPHAQVLKSIEGLQKRSVDLVIEAAHPQAVKEWGTAILRKADFLIFSLTALVEDRFRRELENCAIASQKKIFIPHGAILGLDGIYDGRHLIETVNITTIKHPSNLGLKGLQIHKPQVVYRGPVRGACDRFPRNVNVHAAIAVSGIGFDNTMSEIVADPATDRMTHKIEVKGKGLFWKIEIESLSTGEVTGTYTPESVYQTIRRLCEGQRGLQLA